MIKLSEKTVETIKKEIENESVENEDKRTIIKRAIFHVLDLSNHKMLEELVEYFL